VLSRIRKARKELHKMKKKSQQLRQCFQRECAALHASLHHTSEEKAVKEIELRERLRRNYQQLRAVFKPGQSTGLDRIDVPDTYAVCREGEATPRIPLVVHEDIEKVLLPHTKQRFQQYSETPFGHGERRERLGTDCTSEDFQSLSEGTYDWELASLTDEARSWFQELKKRDYVNADGAISTCMTTDEWVSGWTKMRESTASAPGGHFGHYKTAAVAARLPKKHEDYFPELAEVYNIMQLLPAKHGFAPKRWRSCVDAVLEKIPGSPIIEKLRIIMLFEADFNFVLKSIWGRKLVRHAENNNALGNAAQGSRQGRQCNDASLEKLLIYNHTRLTRTSLVTIDNDAKSCYDRIIKSLAMVACVAYGLPMLAAAMHNRTHNGMKHRVKTRQGFFVPYGGTEEDDLEGTGQGSGGSPAIWLIYSVTLLLAFRNYTKGIHIASPYENLLVFVVAILYVDDGMPGVNDADQIEAVDLPTLISQGEQCAQSWERLLFVSGGALELQKCFAYIIYWDLSEGRHRMMEPDEIPGCTMDEDGKFQGPISLTYGEDLEKRYSLVTESPFTGRRTLGVRTAPAGNWDDEYKYRRAQSRELAFLMSASKLSHSVAELGFRRMVCPKLEHPLAVTQFTQEQCHKILSPVLNAALPKMGFNRNMPREVVFGPQPLGGMGHHDFYIEQGIQQLCELVGHLRQDSETGRMMKIELQWCQIQAGTSDHLLSAPDSAIDYIENCFIMNLRDFCRTYKLRLDFTENLQQTKQCQGDVFLMDAFRRDGHSAGDLQKLNACRMYLQVSRLSDITTGDGESILQNVLKGCDEKYYQSTHRWPRQGRPPKEWWAKWRSALRRAFSIDGQRPEIREKLGKWFGCMTSSEWATVAVTSPELRIFKKREDGRYSVYYAPSGNRRSSRRKIISSNIREVVDEPPYEAVPATLKKLGQSNCQQVFLREKHVVVAAAVDENDDDDELLSKDPRSFEEFVSKQPDHIAGVLGHCDLSEQSAQAIADLILSSSPIDCGTDGGLLELQGTFGFAWADKKEQKIITEAMGRVCGSSSVMSSTRTELCGIFAAVTYLRLVIEYYDIRDSIPEGLECSLFCDSKAALSRVEKMKYNNFGTSWRCRQNYDLEAAIRQCLDRLPITINFQWVKGHADRRKKPEKFTWAEVLNMCADDLATQGRQASAELDSSHWPEQVVSVVAQGERLVGRLAHELRYCCTVGDLHSYYQNRYEWSASTYKKIDNDGIAKALARKRGGIARRLQKLRCGWLPVNRRLARIDPDCLCGCSSCTPTGALEETVDHIFQCPERERRAFLMNRLHQMREIFREWKTAHCIIEALTAGATAWVRGERIPAVQSLDLPDNLVGQLTAQAYTEQGEIGWNVLFRGFWAASWRSAQEAEFDSKRFREKQDRSDLWMGRAISWFFDLFEALWKLRNAVEHGTDPAEQRVVRLARTNRAIRRLYEKGKSLSYHERRPFREDKEVLLAKTLAEKELWVHHTEILLAQAFKRDKQREKLQQRAITEFFQ